MYEVGQTDATLQTKVLAMTILIDKPEVDRIDAALYVEELVEIYITPTPKGWREVEKVKTIFID